MRAFCWACHRPQRACFCALVRPFEISADFALIVHPDEASSTVGTAWIMRKSILNIKWFRTKGNELDSDPAFIKMLNAPDSVALLLFPGFRAFNLNQRSDDDWKNLVPTGKRPLFIVADGTWTQATAMLRKSALLRNLPRVSFDTTQLSEYGFKKQPHPKCLSSVEGVHRVIETLALRGWDQLPSGREHDQMIEIFRGMVKFQLEYDIQASLS